jgi:hypothetical protein
MQGHGYPRDQNLSPHHLGSADLKELQRMDVEHLKIAKIAWQQA